MQLILKLKGNQYFSRITLLFLILAHIQENSHLFSINLYPQY